MNMPLLCHLVLMSNIFPPVSLSHKCLREHTGEGYPVGRPCGPPGQRGDVQARCWAKEHRDQLDKAAGSRQLRTMSLCTAALPATTPAPGPPPSTHLDTCQSSSQPPGLPCLRHPFRSSVTLSQDPSWLPQLSILPAAPWLSPRPTVAAVSVPFCGLPVQCPHFLLGFPADPASCTSQLQVSSEGPSQAPLVCVTALLESADLLARCPSPPPLP